MQTDPPPLRQICALAALTIAQICLHFGGPLIEALEGEELVIMSTINWLFGRGLSISCNLPWKVPESLHNLPREQKIERIKSALRSEMDHDSVDCSIIHLFLKVLAERTVPGWRHRLITTNWDYLLQREILALNLKVLPQWLANSHVSHLNGTVEELPDNFHRSPFLLEGDSSSQRFITREADMTYNQIIWDRAFVVVGMSFECETDKFLLTALNRVEDDLPIGESNWVVVNPDANALQKSCAHITLALPRATVQAIPATLDQWVHDGLREVRAWGAIAF